MTQRDLVAEYEEHVMHLKEEVIFKHELYTVIIHDCMQPHTNCRFCHKLTILHLDDPCKPICKPICK